MSSEILSFLKTNNFIILYGIALLLAITNYRKYFDSVLKFFPILIGYTFLTEILGGYIWKNESFQIIFSDGHSVNNGFIYNVFDIIFFSYFFYVFWKVIRNVKHKKFIKYSSLIFLIACFINPIFQNFFLYPQIYAISIGSLNLVICILLYFKQLKGNENLKNLLFWVAIGLLVFYVTYPFLMTTALYYGEVYIKLHFRQIQQILICLMYTCFIIGFLKMRRMKPIEEEK